MLLTIEYESHVIFYVTRRMFMIYDDMVILQDGMDVLKVEPASCCETCLTDNHDGNDVISDIKLETETEVEDVEDPLLITSPDIKTESEVIFTDFILILGIC
jgi:hypothetical protein